MTANIKHTGNIIEIKTSRSPYKQIEYPNWAMEGDGDFGGVNYSVGTSCLSQPFLMVAETHAHDFDQIISFTNADQRYPKELDADIEFTMGEEGKLETYLIDYAACIYIPAGILHGPLNIKRVGKPIIFRDVTLYPWHSVRPLPKASER